METRLLRIESEDGVPLAGALKMPDGPGTLPFDLVIQHHGQAGNFYSPNLLEPVGERFLARGCAVLRVNNRGHDLLYNGPDGRLGAAVESIRESVLDWSAWIACAGTLGYERIAVWGHSLGAVKTLYFASSHGGPPLSHVIATSPPRFSHSSYLARPDGTLFRDQYAEAEALVTAGEPERLLSITVPTRALVSARTYLDKYGPDETYEVCGLLTRVDVPTLVTVGGEEGKSGAPDRFVFEGLARDIAELAERAANLSFALVPSANHAYAGRTDELWQTIEEWTERSPAT